MSEADSPQTDAGPFAGPTADPAPSAASSGPSTLEDRERTILAELAREVDAWVTFQGLRRQLGVHQQALSRTLRRLERSGLISHAGKGYQLTDAGFGALRSERPAQATRPVIPVLQAILPPYVQASDVAQQLSRRWFGGLRWYGRSGGPGETSLHWMADGSKVTVRVSSGGVTLEIEDTGDGRAFAAARPLLAALAELYGAGAS